MVKLCFTTLRCSIAVSRKTVRQARNPMPKNRKGTDLRQRLPALTLGLILVRCPPEGFLLQHNQPKFKSDFGIPKNPPPTTTKNKVFACRAAVSVYPPFCNLPVRIPCVHTGYPLPRWRLYTGWIISKNLPPCLLEPGTHVLNLMFNCHEELLPNTSEHSAHKTQNRQIRPVDDWGKRE